MAGIEPLSPKTSRGHRRDYGFKSISYQSQYIRTLFTCVGLVESNCKIHIYPHPRSIITRLTHAKTVSHHSDIEFCLASFPALTAPFKANAILLILNSNDPLCSVINRRRFAFGAGSGAGSKGLFSTMIDTL